jgi:hypothetical protein
MASHQPSTKLSWAITRLPTLMSVQFLAASAFSLVAGGMLFAVAAVASLEASLPLLILGLGLPEAAARFGRDLAVVRFALALVVMVLSISGLATSTVSRSADRGR